MEFPQYGPPRITEIERSIFHLTLPSPGGVSMNVVEELRRFLSSVGKENLWAFIQVGMRTGRLKMRATKKVQNKMIDHLTQSRIPPRRGAFHVAHKFCCVIALMGSFAVPDF
eukprot:Gregarina_sp_Poly_1__7841@NODE_4448_length_594_cov_3_946869_g2975_i0_p1_GENE_NODE_4448_length_594_cov_3_946869_g2975_i0NODE_4448_length_594_cov_3_946869_g2975_i0_p1_ORF_typecomplete_len112_score8_40Plasmid_RAQPRD/PF09686_10/0_11_NODE_4448_length_594_cov_3_946869_g2975_i093428